MAIKKIKIKETGATYEIDNSVLNSAATINGNSIVGTGNINVVSNPWTKINTTSISVGSGTGTYSSGMSVPYDNTKLWAIELTLTNPSGKDYVIVEFRPYTDNYISYYAPSFGSYVVRVLVYDNDIYLETDNGLAPTVSINNVYGV